MVSSSSTNTMIPQKKHDVYISFRGEDTLFTSHLLEDLCRKGIDTFIDHEVDPGGEISECPMKAIEGSTVSIIMFTNNYISSTWCLSELEQILECKNNYGQIVIPVYYQVDRSDVWYQADNLANVFSVFGSRFKERVQKLSKWKSALRAAASLPDFPSHVTGSESDFIKKFVDDKLEILSVMSSADVDENLVGVESRIKEIGSFLTIIACAIFNSISNNFEIIRITEGVTSYLQETEETTLPADVEDYQSSLFHPDIYQLPLQITDTTSLNNAQESVYEDAESDNSESSWVSAWENNVKVPYVPKDALEKWEVWTDTTLERKNFESIKGAEGATSSFQKIEEITPDSEVEGFLSSTVHPNNNQVPSQTTDMTGMRNRVQALKYEDVKSGVGFISPIEVDVPLLHLNFSPSWMINLENSISFGIVGEQEWQTTEDGSSHSFNRWPMNTVNEILETKRSEDDHSHLSSWRLDQMLYSDSADTSTRHHNHAAGCLANDTGLPHEPLQNHDFPSSKNVLQNCAQGVESQPFPSFSSSQPDNLGNIPKQGREILGELSTNSFGECKEFGSNLLIQGEVQVFRSKKALSQWTQEFGRKNGFAIVTKRSDLGKGGTKPRITFCCERGGKYRNTRKIKKGKEEKQLRIISTKKCGCPFTLKGRKLSSDDNWMLEVVNGVHNHPITKPLEGRSYEGRLSEKEILLLTDMYKSNVRPTDILAMLKNRDATNNSNIKHIYNAFQRYKKAIWMPKRSQMQQLLSKLSEYEYIEQHRTFDNTDIIRDLFWAHPVSMDLLHAYPCVLLMDCTHKTHRYDLPLLEIVGVTSTNMTFVVAFVYLESEQEDNYMWALESLRSSMGVCALPTVILSDKELALMSAIEKVFPDSKHLLCRWHIHTDILTNCKNLFATNEGLEKFIMSWNVMVLSSNENELIYHLNSLRQEFSSYPQAIEYVTSTWLNNYKERFVSAWTNKIMHFGILTKNRTESSHSRLKKQLHSSQGNFETSWVKIHSLLELQLTDIRASFENSLTAVQDQFKTAEFKELRGFISIEALHMVLRELNRANSIGVDASKCSCIIRCTHGLPCAHEIAEFKRQSRPIPLASIDSYWRKLHLVPAFKKQKAKLDETEDDTQSRIPKKVTEIVKSKFTSLMEPEAKKENRSRPNSIGDSSTHHGPSTSQLVLSGQVNCSPGFMVATGFSMIPAAQVKRKRRSKEEVYNKRLKSNAFVSSFPVGLQPYIYDIKNVAADGHCGFRAIADLMGFGENEWLQVRNDLLEELESNVGHYLQLYGTFERVKELIDALSYFKSRPKREHWMTMPDMGHLIASAYDVVLFLLSSQQCLTFLPLRSMSTPTDSHKAIAIGFVNGNHFVEVFLSSGHSVPPITSKWKKFHRCCDKGWETVYISRIQDFKRIIGNDVATDEIIIDSSSDD